MHQFDLLTPDSIEQLMHQSLMLAGISLGELAKKLNISVPTHLDFAKGWPGQLIEKTLGADAGNLDLPDFQHLGVELKTLPINAHGLPQESTYLCRVTLPLTETDFYQSRVWRKCARILWVPVEASHNIPVAERKIGTAVLWSPSTYIEGVLKQDWEELMQMMRLGQFDMLSARLGTYLQLRPKAASARTKVMVTNAEGEYVPIVPKGFYLRPQLTQQIVAEHYVSA